MTLISNFSKFIAHMDDLTENMIRGSRVIKSETIRDSEWFEEKPEWWQYCFKKAVKNEIYHLRQKNWTLTGGLQIPIRHPDTTTSAIIIPEKFLDLDPQNKNPT